VADRQNDTVGQTAGGTVDTD